jgi:hypothetical protein
MSYLQSLVHEQKYSRNDAKDGQEQAAVWHADAEHWHEVAENDPYTQQKHPLRAIHGFSVGHFAGNGRAAGATAVSRSAASPLRRGNLALSQ